ncbi:MAG: ExbD/TolR family protein [Longimicrobiales bacterium]
MSMSVDTDSNQMSEINVTPLVDVMLVLLIIFMIVTPTIVAGFQAQMPSGINLLERPEDDQRTTLGIDREGNYYLNKAPIAKENTFALLQREFARHPLDKVLFVKADRELDYAAILEAMDLAKRAGARVVAAVTTQAATLATEENRNEE